MRLASVFTRSSLTLAVACGAVLAQDQAATTTTSSQLVITTTDSRVASGVQRMFGGAGGAPAAIGEGMALVMSLDDGGKLATREAAGEAWLVIEAKPAFLMKTFGKQVRQARMTAGMMGGMALAQAGIEAEAIDEVMDALFEFPNQVETLTVTIPRKYEAKESMAIAVGLAPKAETWFAGLVASLKPHDQGLRRLHGHDAMMTADFDLDFAAIYPSLEPMVAKFTTFMVRDEALRAKVGPMLDRFYKGVSGPGSMSMDFENGMQFIMELCDPDAVAQVMADPAYAEYGKVASEMAGGVADVTPNALTHRDVAVTKTVVELDDPGNNPFAKDGKTVTMAAISGGAMLMTSFGDAEAGIKSLIDLALDGKLARAPLGKLMTAHIDVGRFMAFISEQMGGPPSDDAPDSIDVSLAKNVNGLRIEVNVK